MKTTIISSAARYFPAILCAEHDSPIDALVSLCVPRDEAMDLVVASWANAAPGEDCLLAVLEGGRTVAVLATAPGRWAACNAFLDDASDSASEAGRRLARLLRRGRRGYVAILPADPVQAASISSISPVQ